MTDLNKLIGSIKRIHNITNSSERILDAMIVDYTYNPNMSTHRQHKIDYVTTEGVIGNIFVNDKTTYTDIEVSEHVKKYLLLIKESMLKRKKAYEVYLEEAKNIEVLTIDLLKEDKALSKESFKEELSSKLAEKSIHLYYEDKVSGKTILNYTVDDNINLEVIIKKHFINSIRIIAYKGTDKLIEDLDFISVGIGRWLNATNEDKYNEFINDYEVLDYTNSDFIKLVNANNLYLSTSNYLVINDKTENVNFKALHTLITKNKGDIMLLNNDTVDIILNLLQFVK